MLFLPISSGHRSAAWPPGSGRLGVDGVFPPSSRLGLGPGAGWGSGCSREVWKSTFPEEHLLTPERASPWIATLLAPHQHLGCKRAERSKGLEALPWRPTPPRKCGAKSIGDWHNDFYTLLLQNNNNPH